jgi:hypothetical protein
LRLDHEQAMLKQRLSGDQTTVAIDTEVDDPLAIDPPRVVDVDWNNGRLQFSLNTEVNTGWIRAFQNMPNIRYAVGAHPTAVTFRGREASIPAGEHEVTLIAECFKEWLPVATRVYRDNILSQREQERQREMQQLRRQREHDEQRQRVLNKIRV